jgi:hypothetical protein
MNDWTPGPWTVETVEGGSAVYAGERIVAAYTYCYPEGPVPLEEADARLIAAAPEMVPLLERVAAFDIDVFTAADATALLARIKGGQG